MQLIKLGSVQRRFFARMRFYISTEPFLEIIVILKQSRHYKMQKSPQLSHRVLNRRARQQQSVPRIIVQKSAPTHR